MNPPDNRATLPPGPDDLTITERVIRMENENRASRREMQAAFAQVFQKLDALIDDVRAGTNRALEAHESHRRNSSQIKALSARIDLLEEPEDEEMNGGVHR